MEQCLFCKIVDGKIPAEIVYRDDSVVAFKDINPQAPVHVLVIPVKHVAKLTDPAASDGKMLSQIFATIARLAGELGLEKGFRVVANCGDEAGQTVHHIHFHVLGKRRLNWPPG
ncbi:MAG TPA: histidine triad nucleotide-binding protein [Candidatus Rifleibacterium sp.]|jgi:histidine triad (HIT) family protein|nr:histidine triad nucleotide-binding protein [Candidatus Rifleibacterium sp.]HNS10657.1 histidine triad nucleotide-binding protein [Candidatus Ozemobacteraceae bacterium]HNW10955.1 histidine triad nucleotide-binding protein [Candidatus Rifleibacterium sp.]HOI89234.1 histidine triad nucleotide-binding protein [Candidatus Rifleibacterium sp.]HPW60487.1 histidine triad nucleotide-binding protein [Candidatus Rifleibacterium sp.]